MVTYYHHLLHNTTTIEISDDIVVVIFFATKPPKKATTIVVIFVSIKAIKEGDGRCCHVLILKHKEQSDNKKLWSPLLLQHHHK
jgi:hypothetical protein